MNKVQYILISNSFLFSHVFWNVARTRERNFTAQMVLWYRGIRIGLSLNCTGFHTTKITVNQKTSWGAKRTRPAVTLSLLRLNLDRSTLLNANEILLPNGDAQQHHPQHLLHCCHLALHTIWATQRITHYFITSSVFRI